MDIPDYLYKFHRRGGHEVTYAVVNQEAGSTSYFQYLSLDGYWFIMKSVRAGAETAYTFTAPIHVDTTSAAAGWAARAAGTYVDFNEAFA